jgi:hypothetical protein
MRRGCVGTVTFTPSSPVPGSGSGPDSPRWRGNDIAYRTALDRVERWRGKASQHRCVDCGKPAEQWAYNRADPNEIEKAVAQSSGRVSVVQWSADPDYYEPRCRRCHRAFGRRMRLLRERESRIRALLAEGLSIPAIAAEVGCARRTVQGVIRSQTDEVANRLDTAIIKTRTTGKTSKPGPADRLAD